MTITLAVCEKTPGGSAPSQYDIEVHDERQTVRELIRNIVFHQVYDHNTATREWQRIIAAEAEMKRNPKHEHAGKALDWVPKYEQALSAFEKNQIVLLVDDRQIEDLDSEILVNRNTKVTFLKLIPLVGG